MSARGVVTAEAGRTGTPQLLTIGDATAGIAVRLPAGTVAPSRGTVIVVTGPLGRPVRPARDPAGGRRSRRRTASGPCPIPSRSAPPVSARKPTDASWSSPAAWRRDRRRPSSGDLSLVLERAGEAPVKVMSDATSGITTAAFQVGATYRIVGIGGQRATRAGALDGYRLWARDVADVVQTADPDPRPSAPPVRAPARSRRPPTRRARSRARRSRRCRSPRRAAGWTRRSRSSGS